MMNRLIARRLDHDDQRAHPVVCQTCHRTVTAVCWPLGCRWNPARHTGLHAQPDQNWGVE